VVRLLICDGVPQFTWVTEELALCWVHEGRHYQKLFPYVPQHQELLDDFLKEFWEFYRELLAYRQLPTLEERTRLETEFDTLFATKTGYWALDERIALTRAKKGSLLMVLEHPEIPVAQQLGGTGCKTAGTEAEDQLRAASGRGNQGVGHLHVAGWDHPEVGSELLPLHPGPNFRGESDTPTSQHH
jgi:hypothetical protein